MLLRDASADRAELDRRCSEEFRSNFGRHSEGLLHLRNGCDAAEDDLIAVFDTFSGGDVAQQMSTLGHDLHMSLHVSNGSMLLVGIGYVLQDALR
jgi:hypothetical protein